MLYHAVRAVHRGYALTLFWLYVGLFGLAFCFIFFFPPVTIALLFVGIFGLVAAYLGGLLLGITENSLARTSLRRDLCPRCGEALGQPELARGVPERRLEVNLGRADSSLPEGVRHARACPGCGARFESSGAELDEEQAVTASIDH